jgi:two-component system response regulator AtoC
MREKIVIIEDDAGVRFFLEEALRGEGYRVASFESYEDFLPHLDAAVSLVIMDIRLPGMDGLTATDDVRRRIDAPIIIVTAYGTKKNALEAIRRGAADFFVKPVPLQELKVIVKRVLGTRRLRKEVELLREEELISDLWHGVVGRSEAMKDLFRTIEKTAGKDLSVLVSGETGTGKEEMAKLIHKLSGRKGELIVVNCASIPDNLLESELFGYEKGAFTGAIQAKPGRIEGAEKGTVLLDEIAEMSPYLQAKLLRLADGKEFERLGSTKSRHVDVRIVSTANKPLDKEMKEGRFREDLYYRLSQVHLHIPPLRERKEDVPPLIDMYLLHIGKESTEHYMFEEPARKVLVRYDWPGNVRELINVIKRAAAMCDGGTVTVEDLPLHLQSDRSLVRQDYTEQTLDDAISELERTMLLDTLKKTRGSQVKAAKLLGISERSMWYRVKKYGIDSLTEW